MRGWLRRLWLGGGAWKGGRPPADPRLCRLAWMALAGGPGGGTLLAPRRRGTPTAGHRLGSSPRPPRAGERDTTGEGSGTGGGAHTPGGGRCTCQAPPAPGGFPEHPLQARDPGAPSSLLICITSMPQGSQAPGDAVLWMESSWV